MATTTLSAQEASELIQHGQAPTGLTVHGHLRLANTPGLRLPDNLTVTRLTLDGCSTLNVLPRGLRCYELSLRETQIKTLPADLHVEYRLDLSRCEQLEALPVGLKVGSLVLSGCTSLRRLPEGLDVCFLDLSGCLNLTDFPERGSIKFGRLNVSDCARLRTLPDWLTQLAQLNISGCVNLTSLPQNLQLTSSLDVANTALSSLPPSLSNVQLRWHDVAITPRIAFQPETITAREVLNERNAELRRVMMERMGYENFIEQAAPEVLDQDVDPGGERRLLRVAVPNDESLVTLAVLCPSTGHRYLIRVPPGMCTCRQAAAWIAGFDNPDQYKPVAET